MRSRSRLSEDQSSLVLNLSLNLENFFMLADFFSILLPANRVAAESISQCSQHLFRKGLALPRPESSE